MFTYDSKKQKVKKKEEKKFVFFSQIFSILNVFKIVNHHNNLIKSFMWLGERHVLPNICILPTRVETVLLPKCVQYLRHF